MLQPWKTEQNRGISTPPPPPPPWHSVFSKAIWRTERMLMWAESNLAYTPIPQQTYYAAVRVKGERLEGMGGGCGAAGGWEPAAGWRLSPSSVHQLPLTHTYEGTYPCVSTLYALTHSPSVPSVFPVWCQCSPLLHAGASCPLQICPAVWQCFLSPLLSLWWLSAVHVWPWCHVQPQWHLSFCSGFERRASWKLQNSSNLQPTGAERLWELQACGADVKHTVTEGRQSERQGYCQSLTAAQKLTKTYSTCHGEWEGGGRRNDFVVLMRMSSSFKSRPHSVKHLHTVSTLIKPWSKNSHPWERNCIYCVERTYSWFGSRWSDVGLSRQGDGNEHGRWSVGLMDTCAGPWALRRSPLLLLLLPLCHLSVSPMVSSHGLLLRYNRFHLPVKPPGRPRSGTKDSESQLRKEGRRDFSLQYKHISSLPSPPLKVPCQTKSKCCRVLFLFLSGIL